MWIECPHCHIKVLPNERNICPSCLKNVLDLSGTNPSLTTIVLTEKTIYPDKCLNCCQSTTRKIEVGEKLDPMAWHPEDISLWIRGTRGGLYKSDISPSVIVSMPQCKKYAKSGKPKIIHIEFEKQELTILVHREFKRIVEEIQEK
jgi:hypothetical protein